LKAQQLLWTAPLAFEEADYHFFGAMAQAASCGNDACDQRRQQVVALTAHHKQLEIWAENCPANFENRATLVGAEIARLEGRVLDAEHLYERAIATSGKNGFVHTEAIAYEVAARFYRERGFEKIARTYLTEAVASYSRWGALGKVRQLEENHPWLAPRNQQQAMNLTERLDIESLAKAQQSISSKIEMDTLLEEAMHIVIENAGAQNGLLLTEDDGGALHIIARGGTGAAENKVPLPIGIDQSDLVAGSVVRYVARTKESVVLNDAANEGDFMDDPFIKRERTKSLVCAPLLNLGRLIGVLYLENNLATHLFTPERVQLLKMLLAQAAVALENARVYEALRESEAKYRRIVDTANEGIWLLGADGRTAFVNERMAAMLGYSPEEMVGRRPVEFMPEEDLPDYFERMAQRKKGLPENFECRYRCKDGGSISTLSAAAPIFDDKGVYQGAFAMFTNITERKRAEEALKASEAKFMDLYDNAPDMYMSVNARTASIDECNQTGANILGVPKCEIVGRSVFAIYHPDCRDEAEGTFNEFLDKGEIHDRELALQRHDGSKLDVSVNVSAVRGEDGTILFGRSTLRDITERKQAEEAVRTLSKAIEQSPVSIVITDPAGTIEFANRKTSETTGYTCEEVVGKNSRIFKSGETPTEEYRQLWSTIKAGGVWRGELRNRKKNGELFWESTTIAPVRNATGVISHFVAVKEDVTEKKALEEQLRQTQKMEAVGQLAGGVAHDFNNMLGVIIGSAEMALELTTDESPLRQNIEQIMMAADRSADIARKLLTFARKQTIQPKIIDLNKRIEGMLKLLRRLVGEDIELRWTPGKDVLPVRMDPTQVDQILANLCVNAKDAIAGVGKITIKTCQAACDRLDLKEVCLSNQNGFPTDNHVMLAVSDNGCGMDKGTLDRIFEPFFTTKGLGKGTGLGLATVYGIVKQNDGLIKVESEPGAGSTFRIFLPGQAVKPEEALTDNPAAPIPRGHETILLVEDDSAILEVVKRMLRDLGYTVWATPSPRAAIGMVGENPQQFALLVTDVVMPEMSGLDLMKDLTSRFPELQCLFMSGYTGDVVANRGVVGEEFHLIQKPFSKKDLAVAVRAALDGKW
jgi:two-component system cell cycle sensor histidine kinase/response regulator CckA